ncbi:MAG: hypothetical protein VCF24_12270 [Candidatus Latescibacterota bacterium]
MRAATGVRFDDIINAYGVRLYRFAGPTEPTKNELNALIDPSFEWDAAPSVPAAVYADVGAGRGATYFVDKPRRRSRPPLAAPAQPA